MTNLNQNRIAKATRYADAIEANGNPVDEVQLYGPAEWAQVATAIAENPPSRECVELIVALLKERKRIREEAALDPFRGLDGKHTGTTVGGASTNPL